MKKIVVIFVVALVVFSPRLYWQWKDSTPLEVLIIDKTVPNEQYREHQGLLWFLTNQKIVKSNGQLYDGKVDYYGYDSYMQQPMASYKHHQAMDIIYIADTYGVYSDDLEQFSEGDRSEKIYGGMTLQEWNEIMKSKQPHTTLIAEYNSFATPTEASVRQVMEQQLNVQWSGWTGRYFEDLMSDEVPDWLIQNYESQYQKQWPFKHGGIAFVHTSDQVVIIDEQELDGPISFKMTSAGKERLPGVDNSEYPYWFDIVTPINDSVVYAQYELAVSQQAQQLLAQQGIPLTFPAVTADEQTNVFYFSGDFADYTKDNLMKWQGSEHVMKIFSNEVSDFMWATYIPLLQNIITPTN
ncbi:hypothetical protein [Solibacillus daqui]|uniref:hypothetical protein n=1 Tax=Solibacillus daqui TaxID=2912187 RepID=UPI0023673F7E|nr:hypothetical protein [Solibacillus daqui]